MGPPFSFCRAHRVHARARTAAPLGPLRDRRPFLHSAGMRWLILLPLLAACDIPQAEPCRELLMREDCTGLDEEAAGESGTCWRTTIEVADRCAANCQASLDACDAAAADAGG